MPRPAGRAGSQVIHPGWAASNRPAATSVLADWCSITRPGVGDPTFDPATGTTSAPAPSVVVTALRCRVEVAPARGPEQSAFGEQTVTSRGYVVQIPWDWTDVAVDDVLTVTVSGDPGLVGRALRVLSVAAPSLQWSRVLHAIESEG